MTLKVQIQPFMHISYSYTHLALEFVCHPKKMSTFVQNYNVVLCHLAGSLNCAAFTAGMLEAVLNGANFVSFLLVFVSPYLVIVLMVIYVISTHEMVHFWNLHCVFCAAFFMKQVCIKYHRKNEEIMCMISHYTVRHLKLFHSNSSVLLSCTISKQHCISERVERDEGRLYSLPQLRKLSVQNSKSSLVVNVMWPFAARAMFSHSESLNIISGVIFCCVQPAKVTVHWHKGTCFMIKFDESVIARDKMIDSR